MRVSTKLEKIRHGVTPHKLPRVMSTQPLSSGAIVALSTQDAHHLGKVLRQKSPAHLRIFNDTDGEYLAQLQDDSVLVGEQLRTSVTQDGPWLLFVPPKRGACEMIIEKATELGVRRITPLTSQFGQIRSWNLDRILRICQAAARQCERLDLPVIDDFAPLHRLPEFLQSMPCAAAIARLSAPRPHELFQNHPDINALLIGPEGGFDQKEIDFLHNTPNVYSVSLGDTVLRAETAAIMLIGCRIGYKAD